MWTPIDTPLGPMTAAVQDGVLRALSFGSAGIGDRVGDLPSVTGPLHRYFGGDLRALEAIAVAATGTPPQQAVWCALRAIPVGSTASYADIARAIGRPSAVRAVGAANRANPIGIVVPCHRVLGAVAPA